MVSCSKEDTVPTPDSKINTESELSTIEFVKQQRDDADLMSRIVEDDEINERKVSLKFSSCDCEVEISNVENIDFLSIASDYSCNAITNMVGIDAEPCSPNGTTIEDLENTDIAFNCNAPLNYPITLYISSLAFPNNNGPSNENCFDCMWYPWNCFQEGSFDLEIKCKTSFINQFGNTLKTKIRTNTLDWNQPGAFDTTFSFSLNNHCHPSGVSGF